METRQLLSAAYTAIQFPYYVYVVLSKTIKVPVIVDGGATLA